MLAVNLVPAVGIYLALGGEVLDGQQVDYQESREFRNLISGRLSDLLSVATGGKTAIFSDGYGYYSMEESGYRDWLDRKLNEVTVTQEAVTEQADDYQQVLEDVQRHRQEEYEAYLAEYGIAAKEEEPDWYVDSGAGYGYGYDTEWTLNDYMADMAHNKNIRYAVVYQDKLLYTNIEAYEGQMQTTWDKTDFYSALSSEEYNFSLWYNRQGDGKVQIVKDGQEVDVYGDGIYGDDSQWYVPGYANFTLGDSAKDAVVFIAAAKEPQLYLVGDYAGYGVDEYGGSLYYMKLQRTALYQAFQQIGSCLIASVILLALAALLHKSKRLAEQKIAAVSGKIFLELKIFIFLFGLFLLAGKSADVLSEAFWKISNGFSSQFCWSGDITYEVSRMLKAGGYLAAFYWLIYLAVLDWKGNRKAQKKPLISLLRTKDFKYPIQKRLVRRQRIALLIEIAILFMAGTAASVMCLLHETASVYVEYEAWEWAYSGEYGGCFGFDRVVVVIAVVALAVLLAFMMIDICTLRRNRRLAEDIGALADQIRAVREGNLTTDLQLSEDTDLQEAAQNLNEIQKGMEAALREQVKSERMKVDLVTNVSHDIKTPLTSIVSYVELLRQEQDLPEHVKEFIQILGEKSERLRNIVQDVFEVSKATAGQLPMKMEILDMGKLLRQTLADMNGQIVQSSFTMKVVIPETPVPVLADGQRLYRVFQNLLQNALYYSLEGSRIFLTLTEEGGLVIVRMKNTSSVELTDSKDFTERFVRGDESRTDGGSGLGLSIAKSFTQACGGDLTVETDADLFTVTVSFRKAEAVPSVEEESREA
jgi:signal transduction histidine kinase